MLGGEVYIDDIDYFGNWWLWMIDELVCDELWKGFFKLC